MKRLLHLINAAFSYLQTISYIVHFSRRRCTRAWESTIFVIINIARQARCSDELLWKQRNLRLLSSSKGSTASSADTSLIRDNITWQNSMRISSCILMISTPGRDYGANCTITGAMLGGERIKSEPT